MFEQGKGHEALRRGRLSLDGASYFLTLCVESQQSGLEHESIASALLEQASDPACGWALRTMVVMPNHAHLVIGLQPGRTLAEAVRLFKGRTSVVLRKKDRKWQRGYYDHRLRVQDDLLPIFLYVFLNPYRAGLVTAGQSWPGYNCAPSDWQWFGSLTDHSCPLPEWLA